MLRYASSRLQSEHRTLDITEADLFYVPIYVNMLVWPVYGWADGPWWHSVFGATSHLCSRGYHATVSRANASSGYDVKSRSLRPASCEGMRGTC